MCKLDEAGNLPHFIRNWYPIQEEDGKSFYFLIGLYYPQKVEDDNWKAYGSLTEKQMLVYG